MREEFEKFAADQYLLCERSFERDQHQPDEYLDTDCQLAWEAWQASRAAVVVELPEAYETSADGKWLVRRSEVKRIIESLGLKVAP